MNKHDRLVSAYLDHAEAVSLHGYKGELPPAYEEVEDLVRRDPEAAWPIVRDLVRRAVRDEVLAYIAAGPLEDLLCFHPHAFIDRIEALAGQDAHFRRALSGVWGWERMPADVLSRLEAIFGDEPRL
jgi:hypothetical protein